MDKDKLTIIGVFALAPALVIGVALLGVNGADGRGGGETEGYVPVGPNHVGEFRGIWLQVHNNDPGCPFEQYVREMAQTGANTICLSLAAFQEDASGATMFITQDKTPSTERLTGLIRLAKQELNMRVILMPIVLLANPGSGEWRGKIDPGNWDLWWSNYTQYILKYAAIAREHDVDLFMVGSELISTETHESRWRELIAKVRKLDRDHLDRRFAQYLRERFPEYDEEDFAERFGLTDLNALDAEAVKHAKPALQALRETYLSENRMLLSYSANWDHYEVPAWWDALDAVGMTSYYDINPDKKADPDVAYLSEQWKPIRSRIVKWQRSIGKPIIFTEVGWPSQDGCSIYPWNYYHSTTVDLAEQANCMESFLNSFAGEPWVAGILIWKWRDHPQMIGGDGDSGYTPYGKPAMKIVQRYFAAPERTAQAASAPQAIGALGQP